MTSESYNREIVFNRKVTFGGLDDNMRGSLINELLGMMDNDRTQSGGDNFKNDIDLNRIQSITETEINPYDVLGDLIGTPTHKPIGAPRSINKI